MPHSSLQFQQETPRFQVGASKFRGILRVMACARQAPCPLYYHFISFYSSWYKKWILKNKHNLFSSSGTYVPLFYWLFSISCFLSLSLELWIFSDQNYKSIAKIFSHDLNFSCKCTLSISLMFLIVYYIFHWCLDFYFDNYLYKYFSGGNKIGQQVRDLLAFQMVDPDSILSTPFASPAFTHSAPWRQSKEKTVNIARDFPKTGTSGEGKNRGFFCCCSGSR